MNAEDLGGGGLRAVGPLEHLEQERPLDLLHHPAVQPTHPLGAEVVEEDCEALAHHRAEGLAGLHARWITRRASEVKPVVWVAPVEGRWYTARVGVKALHPLVSPAGPAAPAWERFMARSCNFDPILFDLDGTLCDSSADLAAAVNEVLPGLGLAPLPLDQIVGFVGDGVRRLMERVLKGRPADQLEEAIGQFKAAYARCCLVSTRPYPGIPALLEDLAGTRMGVVTNKPAAFARQILRGLGLERHFGAVVGGDDAALKPRPEPLQLALARLGAESARGLMIGDHENDIRAGKAAHLTTVGVCWGFDQGAIVRHAGPDYLANTLAELRQIVL